MLRIIRKFMPGTYLLIFAQGWHEGIHTAVTWHEEQANAYERLGGPYSTDGIEISRSHRQYAVAIKRMQSPEQLKR